MDIKVLDIDFLIGEVLKLYFQGLGASAAIKKVKDEFSIR